MRLIAYKFSRAFQMRKNEKGKRWHSRVWSVWSCADEEAFYSPLRCFRLLEKAIPTTENSRSTVT